ncbi:hypothetical protein QEN19_001863 [Hanseniaspora menglaensis]
MGKTNSKPTVVTRFRNDTPLRILKDCINYPIEIKTNGGSQNKGNNNVKGTLKVVEDNMNVIFDTNKLVKGNSIKYIVLPDIMRFNPLLKGQDELVYTNKESKQIYKSKFNDKKSFDKKTHNKKEKALHIDSEAINLVKELEKREAQKNDDKKGNSQKRKLEQETTNTRALKKAKK